MSTSDAASSAGASTGPAPVVPSASPAAPHAARTRHDPVLLSWGTVGLLLAALVLLNVALSRTVARVDLTEDRVYSVSEATRRVLAALPDTCRIRVYWGEKIPSSAEPVKRRLEGLLDEYSAAGHGKLDVVWVKMDENGRKEAAERNIRELNVSEFSSNEVSSTKDYQGLAILYQDAVEVLGPFMESDEQQFSLSPSLEYDLTSAIFKMTRTKKAFVGIVSDVPAADFMNPRGGDDKYSILTRQVLEKTYGNDLRAGVDLDARVPDDIAVLLVLAPKEWSEKKAFHLEQFLLRGGKVFLLLDAVNLRTAFGGQPPVKSGLEDWLKAAGVDLPAGVLGDFGKDSQGFIAVEEGARPYPWWVLLRKPNLDQGNPATRGIDGIPLYFPGEIVVDAKKQQEAGRKLSVLATTSESGWKRESAYGLDRIRDAMPPAKEMGKRVVMVSLDGTFESFWKGKPSPDEPPPLPTTPPATPPAEPGTAPVVPGGAPPATPPATPPSAPPAEQPAPMGEPPAMTDGDAKPPEKPKDPEKKDDSPSGPKGPEGAPGDGAPAPAPADAKPARLDTGKGVLVVLTDAELVSNDFSGARNDALGFLTQRFNGINGFSLVPNVVDWLTGSDDLLSLRSRGVTSRRLDEVGESKATSIKGANLIGPPVIVLLAGLMVFFVRRHRK